MSSSYTTKPNFINKYGLNKLGSSNGWDKTLLI